MSVTRYFWLALLFYSACVRAEPGGAAEPGPPEPPEFVSKDANWDWVRLTSGEWLKGELLSLERDSLEFDSDVLDEVELDWDDISDLYTNRVMAVFLAGGQRAYGVIRMAQRHAYIGNRSVEHGDILRIAIGTPRKKDLWRGSIAAGVTLRNGNSTQRDVNTSARLTRRTAQTTFRTTYTGNYTENEEVASADNQRANAILDYRLSRKWYLQPMRGEYYRDEFQNISAQWRLGVGASYYVVETNALLWSLSAGPGYQKTTFSEVPVGEDRSNSSAIFLFNTVYDHDLTSAIDLYGSYTATWGGTDAGGLTQNLVLSLDVDLFDDLNLNVAANVDRIEHPQADAGGVVPRNTDVRITVGLSYDI